MARQPQVSYVLMCSCCKRPLRTAKSADPCWECRGRPADDPASEKRPLAGLRSESCTHDLPRYA
jgi:hypothetical protein